MKYWDTKTSVLKVLAEVATMDIRAFTLPILVLSTWECQGQGILGCNVCLQDS
jgi:hypothetical protein